MSRKRLYGLMFVLMGVGPIANGVEIPDAPKPFTLEEAVSKMTVPEGFNVTLYAGEPRVVQPISMTLDSRGRIWVVESMAYPHWKGDKEGKDRVIILEDTDGDGRADSRKVFLENGRNLTSVAVGMGGVWLCSTPELIFVPDRDRDDKPDGPAEVLLDGWDLKSQHNAFNGLTWGPDGWLYGCNGILSNSKIGRPGTPEKERTILNCGVWKYHPTRQEFEVVAHGTTNPWGLAFDQHGQMFLVNCVIKHLFHVIPGGRYERMFGQDLNPYTFKLLESCADHIHWAGGHWNTEGANNTENDSAGGGHAHCGAMIYQGDNWPEKYRNGFYTLNVHGHRMNHDTFERRGSGVVAHHAVDPVKSNDTWFRGVSLMYGPDGAVYMSDWTDAGECHDYEDIHRENGRIYKVAYGKTTRFEGDLGTFSDEQLIQLQKHKNEWMGSQARLELQERASTKRMAGDTVERLQKAFKEETNPSTQLRLLWALRAAGHETIDEEMLTHPHEYVRAWAVQFAAEKSLTPDKAARLVKMAGSESSAVVRLYLASAVQRLTAPHKVQLATSLGGYAEDASDPNIPLLLWYGVEAIASNNTQEVLPILESAKIPLVRQFIAQRLTLRNELEALTAVILKSDPSGMADVVMGMFQALNGQRQITAPKDWNKALEKLKNGSNAQSASLGSKLSLIFGLDEARVELQNLASDRNRPMQERNDAVQALAQTRIEGVEHFLLSMLKDADVRLAAMRGLAGFDNPEAAQTMVKHYTTYNSEEQNEAIATLSTRPAYAIKLLEAVKEGQIPPRDITPFAVRQIQAHKNPKINEMLGGLFGQTRPVSAGKKAEIEHYKRILSKERLAKADTSRGRAAFNRTCSPCHTLFDEGGKLAPELTGSGRTNLDYILENVVDPNAVVWDQYKATYFETADDRLISGVVIRENESTVTIQTQTGTVTLPRKEITARTQSNLSIMPEGLFDTLEESELLDLVSYLQSPSQAPLPQQ